MNQYPKASFAVAIIFAVSLQLSAQTDKDSISEKYVFTKVIALPATPVKDQFASGTCWSYATVSFIESELLRLTKDTIDLSEMYFARKAYESKAIQYVRLHGTANFGQGGQAHDVINVLKSSGMMTESEYSGLANGQTKPSHAELEAVLSAMVGAISKNPAGKLTPEWSNAVSAVLDVYMGEVPTTVRMTQKEFSNKFNPDDYIEITSYKHHPYYTTFSLEIPDNWSGGSYYNVPPDELIEIMDYSLNNGYSIAWDGDVSDKGFSHKNAVAIVPEVNIENLAATERAKWDKLSEKERRQQFYTF